MGTANGMEEHVERRTVSGTVEVREAEGAEAVIEGYAAVFDVLSDELWGFREVILPGAFGDVLENDVRALWQHDASFVLGRTVSGTLRLWEDEIGLRYSVSPPGAQWARDAVMSIRRGDVNQSSFAFVVLEGGDRWTMDDSGVVTRHIQRVAKLFDVSPVTFPAYPATTADVRGMVEALRGQREVGALGSSSELVGAAEAEARARRMVERERMLRLVR